MTRSYFSILRQCGITAFVAASLLVTLTRSAKATDVLPASDSSHPVVATPIQPTCNEACEAQQVLASALREPLRIGSSQFRVGVGSSKLTIGWSLAF